MPEFHYQGRNSQGQPVQGLSIADTADEVAERLVGQGVTPVQIKLATATFGGFDFLKEGLFSKKVSPQEIIMFSRQMYSLTKASIPIAVAVLRLAETVANPVFAKALHAVAKSLESGQNLTNALRQHPKIFSSFIIKLVQVGESTGNLSDIFLQIVEYLELEGSARKHTKAAFHYPMIVIAFSLLAMFIISFFVIPPFAKMYGQFHAQLPLPTRIILNISSFLTHNWYYILGAIGALTVVGMHYFKQPSFQLWWGKYQMQLPIIGDLIKKIILARFTRTFAIVIRTDIPVVEGMDLVANIGNNAYARKCILMMKSAIEHGSTITAAAASTTLFTPLVLQMFSVGEETGSSDDMLLQVSKFYEEEVNEAIKKLSQDVNIILLIAVAGVVFILALGVFLPIWDMTSFANK